MTEKILTPMTRLSHGLTTLKSLVYSDFTTVILNKSASHYNPYGSSSKGVDSDFVLIFQNTHNKDKTFAISFNYIDMTLEEQNVEVSIKDGDNDTIITTPIMTVEEFKEKLRTLNTTLNKDLSKMNPSFVFKTLSDLFSLNAIDIKEETKKAQKQFKKIVTNFEKDLNISGLTEEAKNKKQELIKTIASIEKEVEKSDENTEVKRLEEELKKAKMALAHKTKSIRDKKQYEQKVEDSKKADKLLENARTDFDKFVDKKKKTFPSTISKRLSIR